MTGDLPEERKSGPPLKQKIVGESRVVEFVESIATRARKRSESLGRVLRESAVYRWLTTEPEPSVVVIDLRETYTVGPLIKLIDAGVERATPYWEASTAKRIVDSGVGFGERFARTRPGRLLKTILEPPEPPAADSRDESERGADGEEEDQR